MHEQIDDVFGLGWKMSFPQHARPFRGFSSLFAQQRSQRQAAQSQRRAFQEFASMGYWHVLVHRVSNLLVNCLIEIEQQIGHDRVGSKIDDVCLGD